MLNIALELQKAAQTINESMAQLGRSLGEKKTMTPAEKIMDGKTKRELAEMVMTEQSEYKTLSRIHNKRLEDLEKVRARRDKAKQELHEANCKLRAAKSLNRHIDRQWAQAEKCKENLKQQLGNALETLEKVRERRDRHRVTSKALDGLARKLEAENDRLNRELKHVRRKLAACQPQKELMEVFHGPKWAHAIHKISTQSVKILELEIELSDLQKKHDLLVAQGFDEGMTIILDESRVIEEMIGNIPDA